MTAMGSLSPIILLRLFRNPWRPHRRVVGSAPVSPIAPGSFAMRRGSNDFQIIDRFRIGNPLGMASNVVTDSERTLRGAFRSA